MTDSLDTQREAWSRVAAGWLRQAERFAQFTAPVTARMIERAGIAAGHHVLDLACGVGEPALSIAWHVGEKGSVTAYDLARPMVESARQRAARVGLTNVTFHCADAAQLTSAGHFDALTMRWGLMFLPDAVGTLRGLRHRLHPGARAVFACWTAPERNPVIHLVLHTAREVLGVAEPDPDEPHTFSFADGARLRATLESAGFADVELEAMPFIMLEVPTPQQFWDVMSDLSATVNGLLLDADAATRDRFVRTLLDRARAYEDDGVVRFPAETWIARGTHPG